jgi:hypothetical protein
MKSDLNILGMMRGEKPGYSTDIETNPQRLAVVLMVSPEDAGRTYGGSLAGMSGRVNDPENVSLSIASKLDDAVQWMRMNSDTVPNDFTASVESVFPEADRLTISLKAGSYASGQNVNISL